MFYSHLMLAKKGPLGVIWTAAHLERRLRKNQIVETNISVSVDTILESEVPIALRLSGHLLLGVVRVFSRKVNYLLQDCQETQIKVKHALRPSLVDLPQETATAPFQAITLTEALDFNVDELDYFPYRTPIKGAQVKFSHSATRDQITLPEALTEGYPFGERFDVGMEDRRSFSMTRGEEALSAEAVGQVSYERIQKISEDFIPAMDLELEEAFQAEIRAEEARKKEEEEREIERLRSAGEVLPQERVSFEPGVITPGSIPSVTPTMPPPMSIEEARAVSVGTPGFPSPDIGEFVLPTTPAAIPVETPEFVVQPSPPKRRKIISKKRAALDETTFFPSEVMRKNLADTSDLVRTRQQVTIPALPQPLIQQIEGDEIFTTLSVPDLPSDLSSFVQDFLRVEYAMPSLEEIESERKREEEMEREEKRKREEEMETLRELEPEFPPIEKEMERPREVESEGEEAIERERERARESIIEEEREAELSMEVEAVRKDEFVHVRSPEFLMQPTEYPFEEYPEEEIRKKEEEEAREFMVAELVSDLEFLKDAKGQDIVLDLERPETEPGWSTRTRRAAKYFQSEFLVQRERNVAHPEVKLLETLNGKSKKQAARLFFESLVLKTQSYIQVNQTAPYSEILISPNPKLMETAL